ncbi:CLUMA_CG014637, isoform A [Clunio marinus]|uniref:CLUMA_CG014637, isoform A n=1 Tax=Clunio marinus TaxID=568069 RepID=A0A1J1IRN9_9DIPT|nr:CLUMA_CG014637, isoform A [Clunio marinus]
MKKERKRRVTYGMKQQQKHQLRSIIALTKKVSEKAAQNKMLQITFIVAPSHETLTEKLLIFTFRD